MWKNEPADTHKNPDTTSQPPLLSYTHSVTNTATENAPYLCPITTSTLALESQHHLVLLVCTTATVIRARPLGVPEIPAKSVETAWPSYFRSFFPSVHHWRWTNVPDGLLTCSIPLPANTCIQVNARQYTITCSVAAVAASRRRSLVCVW